MGVRVEVLDQESESIGVFNFLRVPCVGEHVQLTNVGYRVMDVIHLPYGGMVVAKDTVAQIIVEMIDAPF